MKLKNIFKKGTQTVSTATIQKLDKNQLDKIVGGATEVIDTTTTTDSRGRTTKVYEKATDQG